MNYLDNKRCSNYRGDLLYGICKSFIELADKALLSKEIDFDSYAELTKDKYSFMKDYETGNQKSLN